MFPRINRFFFVINSKIAFQYSNTKNTFEKVIIFIFLFKILMRYLISLLFYLVIWSPFVSGQEKPRHSEDKYLSIGKSITYFEDKESSRSLPQIIKQDSLGKFIKGKQSILNFGNSSSAFWIKTSYLNEKQNPLYLVVDAANIDDIDCYILKSGHLVKHIKTGNLAPGTPDVVVENNFILKLPNTEDHTTSTIYLRLASKNILIAPIKLATADVLIKGKASKDRIEYMYIGVLIALLLYNLFLYISLSDRTYLYYTLHVFTLACYLMLYLRGHGFLLGEQLNLLVNQYPHVFLSFSALTSLLFSKNFLNLEKTVPSVLKFYYLLGAVSIVMLLVSISGHKNYAASIAQILTVVLSAVVWIAGIMAYRRGHQPAKYYVLAWFFIMLSVILVTFSLGGILEFNEFTMELVPIGSTLELLLVSFALGDRYRIIMKNERDTRDENLALVQHQKVRLEVLVDKRTEMLTETIQELESSNQVKNKLFSIIAHDLRSPLNSLMSILALNDNGALSMDDIQFLLKENKKNIETINNTLNNLLHWAKSQMDGIKTESTYFELKQLIEELLLVYTPLMHNKEIKEILQIEGTFKVYADENQVKLITRNLIDNAIKFTPKHGEVKISLEDETGFVKVNISNTVSDQNNINNLNTKERQGFKATYGTDNERGIGLGLHLCREYIRSNGGELNITTDEKIVSFSFTLPK